MIVLEGNLCGKQETRGMVYQMEGTQCTEMWRRKKGGVPEELADAKAGWRREVPGSDGVSRHWMLTALTTGCLC